MINRKVMFLFIIITLLLLAVNNASATDNVTNDITSVNKLDQVTENILSEKHYENSYEVLNKVKTDNKIVEDEKSIEKRDSSDNKESSMMPDDTTSINVKKIWVDSYYKNRPENISVNLIANNKSVSTLTLKGQSNYDSYWYGKFEDVPLHDEDGELIEYSIDEVVPASYVSNITFDKDSGFEITNTLLKNITVKKLWDDEENKYHSRPDTLIMYLYREYQPRMLSSNLLRNDVYDYFYEDNVIVINLTENNNWTYVVENLPECDPDGYSYSYWVNEVTPEGYVFEDFNVTYNEFDNSEVYTITNKLLKETNMYISKVWADNYYFNRPHNITVSLYANGEFVTSRTLNGSQYNSYWSGSFGNLPVVDENGLINYTVVEDVPDGYVSKVINYGYYGFNIVNSLTKNMSFHKVWNDYDNLFNLRPENIELYVYRVINDLPVTMRAYTDNSVERELIRVINLTDNNNWSQNLNDLPIFDEYGRYHIYEVEEHDPEGYELVDYSISYSETGFEEIHTFTNNLTYIDIPVNKVWDDNNYSGRPDNVTVYLLANNDIVGNMTLDVLNNYSGVFRELPVVVDDCFINYTVIEDIPAGYNSSITGNVSSGYTITNSRYSSLVIKKFWLDDDNSLGKRPENITFYIMDHRQNELNISESYSLVKVVSASEADNWTVLVDMLPYNEKYVVREEVPDDYLLTDTLNYTSCNMTYYEFYNKLKPVNVSFVKVWDDQENIEGFRANEVLLKLKGNSIHEILLNDANNWSYSVNVSLVDNCGYPINYTLDELSVEGYTTSISGNVTNGYIITNSRTPELINVTVTKQWDDNYDNDGLRPSQITINLFANNEYVTSAVIDSNIGMYTFNNLPKYNNASLIKYTVEEEPVPYYYSHIEGLNIVNIHYPEVTIINVSKIWDDNDNQDGIRPDNISITLEADGLAEYTVLMSENNNWTYIFTGIPKYTSGNLIEYTVYEENVPNGYTVSYDNFTIINKHIPALTSLNVLKIWDDKEDNDGIRPDHILIQLYANNEAIQDPVNLNKENNWIYEYSNLPKYYRENLINYTIKEVEDNQHYIQSVTINENKITLVNKHTLFTTNITLNKIWDDNDNQDGKRPNNISTRLLKNGHVYDTIILNDTNNWKYEFTNLPLYDNQKLINYSIEEVNVPNKYSVQYDDYTIINKYIPEKINISLIKIWDDDNNRDNKRPENVTITLYSNEKTIQEVTLDNTNNWTYTFKDLPKYEHGKIIKYTVNETNNTPHYTKYITNTTDTFTILNKYSPELINITVNKIWDDQDNQDGIRPENITINLMKNDYKYMEAILSPENNWTYTFKDLHKYEEGTIIKYTLEEPTINGYTSTINEYNITNTHKPETKELEIIKEWNDDNNLDGIRPDKVNVQVLADGEISRTIILSEQNNWTSTLNNLPVYHERVLINYTLEEIGTLKGYTATVNGYTITNTHMPETTEIRIIKEWNDNNNQDGIRPENITVTLRANNKTIQTFLLNRTNNWTQIITNLPTNENGKPITYTVTETQVPNYTNTITYNNEKIIINNIHTPQTRNITINKKWNDNNNQDGLRPNNVNVQIVADGELYTTIILSEQNNWTNTLNNLPVYHEGILINYTLKEIGTPDGYTETINGYTITNTHKPETIEVIVIIKWDDLDDIDEIRPENVTILLYKNDKPIENVTISPDEDWRNIFDELPEYENGTKINYTADEILPNGYNRTIEINDKEIIITNIHRPKLVNITINKIWADDNNRDGLRPENVQVQLLSDGKVYATVTLDDVNNWKYSFLNLPKTRKGININYTLREVTNITGYTSNVEDYTITNTHKPEIVDVKVNVKWDDLDDTDKIRPENVTIILYADDKPVKNVTITPDDDWKTIFKDLPKYENGTIINYTADETLPNGYKKTINLGDNEINITNIHRPTTEVNVNIVWDDLDDVDGIRPDNVTVILYDNGKPVDNVTVTNKTWKTRFEDLPKYDENNKLIKYTVDETLPNGYTKTIESKENNFTITNIHRPHMIWTWKLVEIITENSTNKTNNVSEPANNQPAKIVGKVSSYNNWKINNRYSKDYRYNKYSKYNKFYRNHNRHYTHHGFTRHAYRLYIQLYNEYLAGNISFEDFIVLLEKEGVNTQVLNFNEDGTITIDYDNIEDVPDKITVEYKNDDIPSTSDNIDTSNPDNNEAPVIDSGRVEVKSEYTDSSSNVDE